MKSYPFEILTPRGKLFSGEALHTLVPAEDGFVGVWVNHAPYITSSPGGRLEVRLFSGETHRFRVGPGFFQIFKNQAFFLTSSLEEEVSSAGV